MLSEKNKIDKKPAEKRRSKSPKKSPTKKKPVKNTYDIVQFKKMVGKDIITYHKPCKYLMIDDVKYKERIINNMVKTIFLSGYIHNGIIYIYENLDKFCTINNISYAEIKNKNICCDIVIIQISKE
jgi:hypothetical protein